MDQSELDPIYATAKSGDCKQKSSDPQRKPLADPGFQPEQKRMAAKQAAAFFQVRPGLQILPSDQIKFRRFQILHQVPVGRLTAKPRQARIEDGQGHPVVGQRESSCPERFLFQLQRAQRFLQRILRGAGMQAAFQIAPIAKHGSILKLDGFCQSKSKLNKRNVLVDPTGRILDPMAQKQVFSIQTGPVCDRSGPAALRRKIAVFPILHRIFQIPPQIRTDRQIGELNNVKPFSK